MLHLVVNGVGLCRVSYFAPLNIMKSKKNQKISKNTKKIEKMFKIPKKL